MKKIGTIFLLLIFVTYNLFAPVCATSVDNNTNDAQPTVTANSCHSLDADSAYLGNQKFVDNAEALILYEAGSQTLMYAFNADERQYPASLVKIMTALIAVEKGNLSDIVTVTEGAISTLPVDAVSADLIADEQLSLEDLLYCLLLGSANDAAAVIAEHIGGTQNDFVQLMNQYASDIGCTNTNYTNAHGLHDKDQYTTARDTARILDKAMQNEVFCTVFTAVKHTVAATNKSDERELASGNYLLDTTSKLYYDPRVIGGRTGVAENGKRCLAAVAENNGMQLISVVMGAETVYQEDGYSAVSIGGYHETTALLDAGFSGHKTAQILFANQSLRQSPVTNGDCDVIMGPQVSVSAVLSDAVTASDLSFRYSDETLSAPIEVGQKVSTVQIWHQNMCVAEADLFAMNSVDLPDAVQISGFENQAKGPWLMVLWVFIGILGVILVLLVFLRFIRRLRVRAIKKRSRQYRHSRRRSR